MLISNVAQLVKNKTTPKISSISTVEQACVTMLELSERALLVFKNDDLVGVVSEIDVVRKCVAKRLSPAMTEVADIMSCDLKTINSKDSLAEAIEIMQKEGFHHLPVVNGEKVLGLISNDDIPEEYRMLLEHFKEMKNT